MKVSYLINVNKKTIKNIIYGFAIGDALGVPFEFQSAEYCQKYYNDKYITGTHNQLPGTWSDDTSILLCVLDSKGDIEKYKHNLKDWYNNDSKFNCFDRFDIGSGTRQAIESNFTNDSSESKGNACLSVTLGCLLLDIDLSQTYKYVRLTHNNTDAEISSMIYIRALANLITGCNDEIYNAGHCLDSIKLSLNCVDKTLTYKEGVRKAIHFGGDTDSHAAFTGSLLATKYKIPKYYIDNLKGISKIDNIINSL